MSAIKISELNEVALNDVDGANVVGGIGFTQSSTISLFGGTSSGGAGLNASLSTAAVTPLSGASITLSF